jgi:hypothetical protein
MCVAFMTTLKCKTVNIPVQDRRNPLPVPVLSETKCSWIMLPLAILFMDDFVVHSLSRQEQQGSSSLIWKKMNKGRPNHFTVEKTVQYSA